MLERVKQHPVKFPVWRVENDTLYKYVKPTIPRLSFYGDEWKIVVPKDRRKDILHRCHDKPTSGHVGVYKTFGKLLQHYYWPKMRKDVASYVKHCVICAQVKVEQKAPAGHWELDPQSFNHFRLLVLTSSDRYHVRNREIAISWSFLITLVSQFSLSLVVPQKRDRW